MILLDTDVMVDVLRGYEPAIQWLKAAKDDEIGLPGLVAMELLQGCQTKREQRKLEKQLHLFSLFWADEKEFLRAYKDFSAYHLSHRLGLLDVLIAATVREAEAELATFNTKHYSVLKDIKMIQPYERR